MKIAVIYGSVREGRQGIKAAKFIVNQLEKRNYSVDLIDPMEFNIPLLENKFMYLKNPSEILKKLQKIINDADGYVIVTGEYNHSIPPALKNILDHFYDEYMKKPAAIVSYSIGPFGGVRAAVSLRPILGELRLVSIPTMFPISSIQDSFDENGNAIDKAYEKRIESFLDEFEWYLKALKKARDN